MAKSFTSTIMWQAEWWSYLYLLNNSKIEIEELYHGVGLKECGPHIRKTYCRLTTIILLWVWWLIFLGQLDCIGLLLQSVLYSMSSELQYRLKASGFAGIFQDFSTTMRLLRYSASWTEQPGDSQLLCCDKISQSNK